ncbi:MAG: type II toxin-antitoxin system RelE/ParE family toxin [Saprospiraceae bacterium]|nr:type II toxin-antitoxin system RelE/ParE family toxin [Saprospiraceae bacterium]MBK8296518.1 type II toxin-antitoxin system RelE/ParE family toxin [Saprospiraceae bacterium]
MIVSYGDKETKLIWEGSFSKKLPLDIQQIARRKLRMINNSYNINDLRIPPANRLEKLEGKLKGLYSIRINEKWRIIFEWNSSNAYDVKITDYH